MEKKIFLILICLSSTFLIIAQNNLMVAGSVMDEKGEVLIGVTVAAKDDPSHGVVTDLDGKFRISNLKKNQLLRFTYVGYVPFEYVVTESKENLKIVLKQQVSELDEVVVVGRDTQRKISVVGAVSSIEPEQLEAPGTSVSNMLGGVVPGIIAVTRSGEPGNDFSEFWIRGISTFGASQSALVLIDGVEGNLNDLDPSDIESFSVLKDASATAIYGVRGANGVVIVTTKRGKAGKLNISFKTNEIASQSARMPKYVDAPTYAELANEAYVDRGYDPLYSDVELELFRTGMDPDLYPNVNWRNVILKDLALNNESFLSISGGGSNARYYLSLSTQLKDAIFNQEKGANKYDVNVKYHKYSFRTNVDANLTKTTQLSLGLNQTMINQNAPGFGDNNQALWAAQANLTPVTVPVRYSNGYLPSYGTNEDQYSPYVILNYTGYKENRRTTQQMNIGLHQELDIITQGLSIEGKFAYTGNSVHNISRTKMPDLYYAKGRLRDGSLNLIRTVSKKDVAYSKYVENDSRYYYEFRTDYKRNFGDHRVSGLLHYYQEEYKTSTAEDDITAIPQRYQSLSGRATYSYKDTYLLEGNIGYTGSENFKPGSQYGIFPAIAVGWTPSQYQWTKNHIPFINYLKFRFSYGEVGNDRISSTRFPYLTTVVGTGNGGWSGGGLTEEKVGADNLKWESSRKTDLGIDFYLWKSKIQGNVDFFRNKTTGIFQQRATVPLEAGFVSLPYSNIGSMLSWGTDGNISFTENFTDKFGMTLRGNFTYARNNVTYWEQSGIRYPYQSYTDVPYGIHRGLIALGLFQDEADIESSPVQTFMKDVLPGDIKYKDVNGDGQIDSDDIVPLSYSNVPLLQYGFATEFRWKQWTLGCLFEGVSKVDFFYGGTGYYPFAWGATGNILDIVADPNNRWIPESISGDKSTENPNARFPRLTYGNNANNNQNSTFWLADGRYLRLKNAQLSYRFSTAWLKNKFGIQNINASFIGYNLAVWDKVKLWDPAQASGNGAVYPLQRTYTIQLNINF